MAEPVLDNDDIKKRATRRLFVAVALVVLATVILTWLSQYKPSPVTTKPTPDTVVAPPIIAPEPAPIIAAPAEPPPLEQMPPPEVPAAAPAAQAPAAPLPTLGAPPPPRVVSKPLPAPGPGPKAAAPETAKPLVKAQQPVAQTPPPPTPTPAAPPPAPSGYVVQFGVFTNPQNATQLVERLKQLGIAAHTETRVQLGPFKTKAEADAALAKMKEKGISAVVVAH